MTKVKAKPQSILKIRTLAYAIRNMLGIGMNDAINGPREFERLFFVFEEFGYDYQILQNNDPRLEKNEEAKIDITTGKIYISESVYKSATSERFSRALFTLFHEEGHFFLHRMAGFSLSRINAEEKIKPYEDPEWQADTFAAEFLMPYEGCIGLTVDAIKNKYNISYSAALNRYMHINKEEDV